jgi:HEAT repeat protein
MVAMRTLLGPFLIAVAATVPIALANGADKPGTDPHLERAWTLFSEAINHEMDLDTSDLLQLPACAWKFIKSRGAADEFGPRLLKILCDGKPGSREAARTLRDVKHLPTNMLPALIEALKRPHKKDAPEYRGDVALAIALLGPTAKPAVPALTAVYKETLGRKEATALQTEQLPGQISEELRIQIEVIRALGDIGPGAQEAQPLIMAALKDANPLLRVNAALALWRVGGPAKDAVSVLTDIAGAPSDNDIIRTRGYAAQCLGLIGPAAATAAPTLAKLMRIPAAPEGEVAEFVAGRIEARTSAAIALLHIGRGYEKEAVDFLHSVLKDDSINAGTAQLWSAQALFERGEREPGLTCLARLARSKYSVDPVVIDKLLRIAPDPDTAVRLIRPALGGPMLLGRQVAIESLAQLGHAAAPIIPELRNAQQEKYDPYVPFIPWDAAWAIKRIESDLSR